MNFGSDTEPGEFSVRYEIPADEVNYLLASTDPDAIKARRDAEDAEHFLLRYVAGGGQDINATVDFVAWAFKQPREGLLADLDSDLEYYGAGGLEWVPDEITQLVLFKDET